MSTSLGTKESNLPDTGWVPGSNAPPGSNGAGAETSYTKAVEKSKTPQQNTTTNNNNIHKSYPLNLGTEQQLMIIKIYTQVKSNYKEAFQSPNVFNWGTSPSGGSINTTNAANPTQAIVVLKSSQLIDNASNSENARFALLGTAAKGVVEVGKSLDAIVFLNDIKVGAAARGTNKQYIQYIDLYMPESLNFINTNSYSEVSLTDALGLSGVMAGNSTEYNAIISKISGIAGDISGIAEQGNEGYAINPQLQVLYHGPKIRTFQFMFRFTPRSQAEATAVEEIIRTLRFHAAPEYSPNGEAINSRYMVPPSEFEIEFGYLEKNQFSHNSHIPRIAQSVLTSVDVNYAQSGRYATFVDGQPVETVVTLSFTETVILTKEDILNGY